MCASKQVFSSEAPEQVPSGRVLREFDFAEVELSPGRAQTQFEQTQSVLLGINEDSLLKPWRLRAGLAAPGPDMGGWYDEVPLAPTPSGGHGFAPANFFGQWIAALSRGYAINRNPLTRAKLERLLDGYGQAISGRFYTNFYYPAYNYDKMVLGLIDAHRYAAMPAALDLLNRTTAAAETHLPPRALDRGEPQRLWRLSVGDPASDQYTSDESYTLPENLYIASQAGAGDRYRSLAGRYLLDDTFFDLLAENRNALIGHHAYSYFNALNSAMQAYLVTGSTKHFMAAKNGFDIVTATQSFATGAWGPNEEFSEANSGALYDSLTSTHRGFETPCGSFAHFKLTGYLLQATADGRYGDSMERVFYNTVLGAKALQPDGRAFYYSDYNQHATKVYFPDAWPCCAGTLPMVTADYRRLLYFRDADGIFVNLYLPSTLRSTTADGAQLTLTQTTAYPLDGKIVLDVKLSRTAPFAMRLRIPAWTVSSGTTLRVNGKPVPVSPVSGFVNVKRTWKDGDRVELNFALPVRLEAIDAQHPDHVAVVRGPLVLFALTGQKPNVTREQLLRIERISGQSAWRAQTAAGDLRLVPFTEIEDETYATYLQVS